MKDSCMRMKMRLPLYAFIGVWISVVVAGAPLSSSKDELYQLLGVPRSATAAELKRAFRQRSLKLHPDQNGGSEREFLRLKDAYDILRDPARRRRYDQGGLSGVFSVGDEDEYGGSSFYEDYRNTGGRPPEIPHIASLESMLDLVATNREKFVLLHIYHGASRLQERTFQELQETGFFEVRHVSVFQAEPALLEHLAIESHPKLVLLKGNELRSEPFFPSETALRYSLVAQNVKWHAMRLLRAHTYSEMVNFGVLNEKPSLRRVDWPHGSGCLRVLYLAHTDDESFEFFMLAQDRARAYPYACFFHVVHSQGTAQLVHTEDGREEVIKMGDGMDGLYSQTDSPFVILDAVTESGIEVDSIARVKEVLMQHAHAAPRRWLREANANTVPNGKFLLLVYGTTTSERSMVTRPYELLLDFCEKLSSEGSAIGCYWMRGRSRDAVTGIVDDFWVRFLKEQLPAEKTDVDGMCPALVLLDGPARFVSLFSDDRREPGRQFCFDGASDFDVASMKYWWLRHRGRKAVRDLVVPPFAASMASLESGPETMLEQAERMVSEFVVGLSLTQDLVRQALMRAYSVLNSEEGISEAMEALGRAVRKFFETHFAEDAMIYVVFALMSVLLAVIYILLSDLFSAAAGDENTKLFGGRSQHSLPVRTHFTFTVRIERESADKPWGMRLGDASGAGRVSIAQILPGMALDAWNNSPKAAKPFRPQQGDLIRSANGESQPGLITARLSKELSLDLVLYRPVVSSELVRKKPASSSKMKTTQDTSTVLTTNTSKEAQAKLDVHTNSDSSSSSSTGGALDLSEHLAWNENPAILEDRVEFLFGPAVRLITSEKYSSTLGSPNGDRFIHALPKKEDHPDIDFRDFFRIGDAILALKPTPTANHSDVFTVTTQRMIDVSDKRQIALAVREVYRPRGQPSFGIDLMGSTRTIRRVSNKHMSNEYGPRRGDKVCSITAPVTASRLHLIPGLDLVPMPKQEDESAATDSATTPSTQRVPGIRGASVTTGDYTTANSTRTPASAISTASVGKNLTDDSVIVCATEWNQVIQVFRVAPRVQELVVLRWVSLEEQRQIEATAALAIEETMEFDAPSSLRLAREGATTLEHSDPDQSSLKRSSTSPSRKDHIGGDGLEPTAVQTQIAIKHTRERVPTGPENFWLQKFGTRRAPITVPPGGGWETRTTTTTSTLGVNHEETRGATEKMRKNQENSASAAGSPTPVPRLDPPLSVANGTSTAKSTTGAHESREHQSEQKKTEISPPPRPKSDNIGTPSSASTKASRSPLPPLTPVPESSTGSNQGEERSHDADVESSRCSGLRGVPRGAGVGRVESSSSNEDAIQISRNEDTVQVHARTTTTTMIEMTSTTPTATATAIDSTATTGNTADLRPPTPDLPTTRLTPTTDHDPTSDEWMLRIRLADGVLYNRLAADSSLQQFREVVRLERRSEGEGTGANMISYSHGGRKAVFRIDVDNETAFWREKRRIIQAIGGGLDRLFSAS
ncbi:unnamed protein product [Amoebophrya sp. A25]|nr:unnamed protein product [Amoebophrya sp. A25]|eukprot:GSA25T00015863001.1